MQKFQFLLLTYWLESPGFLKEVARDVVRNVPLCGNLQNMFLLKHSPTSHLRHFTNTFCVTPLALHTRHLSCVSDGIGQFHMKSGNAKYRSEIESVLFISYLSLAFYFFFLFQTTMCNLSTCLLSLKYVFCV